MSLLEKLSGILFRPREFFAEAKKETGLADAISYFIVAAIAALLLTGVNYPAASCGASRS